MTIRICNQFSRLFLLLSLLVCLVSNPAVAQEIDDAEAFFMLNALWVKAEGGAEKYQQYLQAAGPLVSKHGGQNGDA